MEPNNNFVVNLYTYLKNKYGVEKSEIINPNESQSRYIHLEIPEICKTLDRHKIIVLLENNENVLIVGEEWPNKNYAWSRIIEVKNNPNSDNLAWLNIISNMIIGINYNFNNIIVLLKILKEYDEFNK